VVELHNVLDREVWSEAMMLREVVKTSGVCRWRRRAGSLWAMAARKSVDTWSFSFMMSWMTVMPMVQWKETTVEDLQREKVY
jgi:hypothetical protein